MADVFQYPCKIPDSEWPWIGDRTLNPLEYDSDPNVRVLCANREMVIVWGGVGDPEASYEYDETVIVSLGKSFYLVQSSGCSCGSPGDDWSVEIEGSLGKVAIGIEEGSYKGYTFPTWAIDDLRKALTLAAEMTV